MDEQRFDGLSRALAGGVSRRRVLKGMAAGALAALTGNRWRPATAQIACTPGFTFCANLGYCCETGECDDPNLCPPPPVGSTCIQPNGLDGAICPDGTCGNPAECPPEPCLPEFCSPPPTQCPESRAAFKTEVKAAREEIQNLPRDQRRAARQALTERQREVRRNC